MVDFQKLKQAMGELDDGTVIRSMNEIMADGGKDAAKALEACQEGMNTVGAMFQSGDYFVADLIFSGDLMTRAMDIIKPALARSASGKHGRMILCTVQGDLHDIGKNIVKTLLEAGGFEVLDLGIDVSPSVIVETARKEEISIIALSGVLTLALDSMKATVDEFEKAGLRDKVKIIVGGAPVTEAALTVTGADEWARNPQKTVVTCQKWTA